LRGVKPMQAPTQLNAIGTAEGSQLGMTGAKRPERIISAGASGTYGLFADAYRQAAADQGVIPKAMQSPPWELVRENFPLSGTGKEAMRAKIEPIWAAVKRGQITPEEARVQIQDIATGGKDWNMPEWY